MQSSPLSSHWTLDPAVSFLNHGSFGATPRLVLEHQQEIRDRIERQPVRFFTRDYEPLLDEARAAMAPFVGCAAEGFAFVPNATAGINAVLRSLDFQPGDELLTTNHEYNASRNALNYVAARTGANVIVVNIPFDVPSPVYILERLVAAISVKTRLLLVDHVSSQTAIVFPIANIVREFRNRGIETLVDGAHAPGMLPLNVEQLGAGYYTGNFHKWVCAPKGSAFLHVREDLRSTIHPTSISHGANSSRGDRPRYQLEFDWTGTADPSAWLSTPLAMSHVGSLVPGGWPEIMRLNRGMARRGRDVLCKILRRDPPIPADMLGSMASLVLPEGHTQTAPSLYGDPLQDALLENHGIEVPIIAWPSPPNRLIRISAHLYNDDGQYDRLALALREELTRETRQRAAG